MANNSDRFLRNEGRSTDLKSEVKREVAKVSEFDSRAQYRSNDRDRSYDSVGRSSPRGSPRSRRGYYGSEEHDTSRYGTRGREYNKDSGSRKYRDNSRERDKGGDVGYNRRGSSRRPGGSRDNSYERYGIRDSSRERYRGRESPREIRDKFSRYRDSSMDRFEGEKYKERRETSRSSYVSDDVELQNLTNKSDRESEVKKSHTGQDWWTCKTKGVKSSEYVEIGSQRGTAQGIRDVQVSMEYDREHGHDEVAEIEREEREVRRKLKEKLAKLKAKRETAVMELENVKAFRVVVQELAEPVTAQVETSHRKPVEPASYWGERAAEVRVMEKPVQIGNGAGSNEKSTLDGDTGSDKLEA
ncbi:serine/threonine-protein kinase fray2-like [Watersipora subatra]|uniref:serine/threonine-protein kinase fray2-like n=1 Tax=Watersipora subatra TaxID=2589382 RepID=UPI00355B9492